ncbi:MAG: ASCH domain-containing protein [Chthonomonas sp.]|nr:ASCH domain-containing protein [Chthonomonas sp.]
MKVLSIRQPWAWAIIHGGKDIENRNWRTNYRGPLAIHAGKQFDMRLDDFRDYCRGDYGNPWLRMATEFINEYDFVGNEPRGAIIGVVDLVDCIPSYACDSPWKAGPDPDYWCWKLANPRPLAIPVLLKGQLGLFEVPGEITPAHLYCKGCHGDTGESTTCGVCGNTKDLIRKVNA